MTEELTIRQRLTRKILAAVDEVSDSTRIKPWHPENGACMLNDDEGNPTLSVSDIVTVVIEELESGVGGET